MTLTRRTVGLLLLGAGALLVAGPFVGRLPAQDQAPNRPEFTLIAKNFRFSPDRLEVTQDDLVKLTIRSEDVAYSFAIDEYRIVRRVPAGASTTFEFRADRPGTFRFYSNLTDDPGHRQMQGQLVVRAQ
ncbi:MAG: cupredoxin domain-containing protein [Acidobacteria bacterium]|nr:cupredoxin domain-containing protein [Acidobacteriota bacterium]